MATQDLDWAVIGRALAEPFNPAVVDFLPGAGVQDDGTAYVMAYVDARAVQERFDTVLGCGGWAFTWEPITLDKELRVVRGSITIGGVTKQDVGTASETEPSKGAVSDAFKRTAVLWGPGRYLYSLSSYKMTMLRKGEKNGKPIWRAQPSEIARLRRMLPQPGTVPPPLAAPDPVEEDAPPASEREFAAIPSAAPQRTPPTPITRPAPPAQLSETAEQVVRIQNAFVKLGWEGPRITAYLQQYNVAHISSLQPRQAAEMLEDLTKQYRARKSATA